MNLEMTEQKMKKLDEAENLALDTIISALKGGEEGDIVNIATKTIAVVARNRITLTARSGMEYSMACRTSTEDELKKYVKVSNPQIRKMIAAAQK